MPCQTLHLDARAPAKPEPDRPCNGCGICCAAETCPAGRIIFRRIDGPCPALEWEEAGSRYRCGLLTRPQVHVDWLPGAWSTPAGKVFSRWIAAGKGCDSDASTGD